jgi:heme oxygenase (biliverdin-IX-beta and delta-forming)
VSARSALRAGTAAEHDRVDRLFSRLDLRCEEDYRRFLLAQAAAFLPIEERLDDAGSIEFVPDWMARRRAHLLRADLAALGADEPVRIPSPPLESPAARLGAIYVLEGSRLGGAVLKRGLAETSPRSFLAAPQNQGSWRKLLESLDMFLYRSDLLEAATAAAKEVFQNFEAGGQLYLESRRQ